MHPLEAEDVSGEEQSLLTADGRRQFGKYELFAHLGRGGMADVALAVARGPAGVSRLAVVKRLRSVMSSDPTVVKMFIDEARLSARLSHPNVVQTYEVAEETGECFIAMEYLEGQPLNKLFAAHAKAETKFEHAASVRIIADALAGLHYAHELKDYDGTPLEIVHRDISPHNIFVGYDGTVKIVDFGIAKAILTQTHTETGVLKGKLSYMAPEQAMSVHVDRRADVFAMGIVLWELVTQQRLMVADGAAAVLNRLLNAPIPRAKAVDATVDPKLDDILAKALEKDPTKRFATAEEMRLALVAWLETSGHTVKQEEIGAIVSRLFEEERAAVKQRIQERLAAVDPGDANENTAAKTSTQRLRVRPDSMRTDATGRLSHVLGDAEATRVAPALVGRARWIYAASAVAVLVAGGFFLQNARTKRAPGPVVAAPEVATAVPAPPPPATAVTVAQPAETASAAASATAPSASAVARPTPPRAPASTGRKAAPSSSSARAAEGAPPEAGPGYLTLDTVPWTDVTENGHSLGPTPIVAVPLSPGPHTLTLDNAEAGLHTTFRVTVGTGEKINKRLMLRATPP